MTSLSRRLTLLRKKRDQPATHTRPKPSVNEHRIPPGEGWKSIARNVWEKNISFPALLPDVFKDPFVLPDEFAAKELLFYDLETTGLSGGAGNIAFLIGLGRQLSERFTVTQLFLGDYPGERALIERYAELIRENQSQVSYNGRAFDSQILKTRFLLNRIPPLIPPQIDLLYPSRRLWKGVLPNLSLGTLEKQVLGVFREHDLPGREAPDAWFDWLDGDETRIGGVFQHNSDDILSLARLLVLLEGCGKVKPEKEGFRGRIPSGMFPSHKGMSRQWSLQNPGLERQWLQAGWTSGEIPCARELAFKLKREKDYPGATAIWKELNSNGRDYSSAVELSKYFEHRLKTPEVALEILRKLRDLPLTSRQREEMDHRCCRLKRKLAHGDSRK